MNKLCILLLLLGVSAYSQQEGFESPDYRLIEKNVKNKNSEYFFEKLFDRYLRADNTLTLNEKRHLYYGFSFTKGYMPYKKADVEEKLNRLLKKQDADNNDLKMVLEYSARILKEYPFSLRIKEYRIFCLKQLQRFDEASHEMKQASIIMDAIASSGDGTTPESRFYVINVINEYEMLGVLGFEFGGTHRLVEGKYDYLSLKENSYNLPHLYFDISRSLEMLKF